MMSRGVLELNDFFIALGFPVDAGQKLLDKLFKMPPTLINSIEHPYVAALYKETDKKLFATL